MPYLEGMPDSTSARRRASLVTAVALILAACGGGNEGVSTPLATTAPAAVPSPDSTAPDGSTDAVTTTPAPESVPGQSSRPAPDPDREIAPDFTLNLGSGSTFVLSEETRPVFMVFWAEW